MSERANRREQILEVAGRLFREHGYRGTSVRQIAEAVGCTEAALYYHFKGGKRELFQQVVALAIPDVEAMVDQFRGAESLRDLALRYGRGVAMIKGGRIQQTLRWLVYEIPHLSGEEREALYVPLLRTHDAIAEIAAAFDSDPQQASDIAWLLMCTSFGYRQIFFDLELDPLIHADVTRLFEQLADGISRG